MAERFTSSARSSDELICKDCFHSKYHHKQPAMCTGLGEEKAMLGSFCPCLGFKRDSRSGSGYQTYVPPTSSPGRSGFSSSSSRYELGERISGRPNLQGKKTTGGPGASPEWVMFGVSIDNRVRLYASTKLSYMELRQESGHFDDLHVDEIRAGNLSQTPWDIRGRMVDFVIVEDTTYAGAIRRLFGEGWRPDGEPTTEDLQRQLALEEARREAERVQDEPAGSGGTPTPPNAYRGAQGRDEDDIVDAEIVEEGE